MPQINLEKDSIDNHGWMLEYLYEGGGFDGSLILDPLTVEEALEEWIKYRKENPSERTVIAVKIFPYDALKQINDAKFFENCITVSKE